MNLKRSFSNGRFREGMCLNLIPRSVTVGKDQSIFRWSVEFIGRIE
jgi:hypothetical protein